MEIVSDSKLSLLELTNRLYMNDSLVLDSNVNLHCNYIYASKVFCDELLNKTDELNLQSDSQARAVFSAPTSQALDPPPPHASPLDGFLNECHDSDCSAILAGTANEINSCNNSIILAGTDNQCYGNRSVCAGVQAVAEHDNTFVWNSDPFRFVSSTNKQQFVVHASNGLLFHLPLSQSIWTEHLDNGMACFCWDSSSRSVVLKTKQHDVVYKSYLLTQPHEIQTTLSVDSERDHVSVHLLNPDIV